MTSILQTQILYFADKGCHVFVTTTLLSWKKMFDLFCTSFEKMTVYEFKFLNIYS